MHFEKDYTYHVYNRSNQTVFKNEDNYHYFLKKFKQHISPYVDVLAWCLMPNHFHFMIVAKSEGIKYVEDKHLPNTQVLSKKFGTFLSSFTKAYNKMYNNRGHLWAHNTKAKKLNYTNNNYPLSCFRYIHENPRAAGLVKKPSDWNYSSFKDLMGERNGTIVNKELVYQFFNIDEDYFRNWVNLKMEDVDLKSIFQLHVGRGSDDPKHFYNAKNIRRSILAHQGLLLKIGASCGFVPDDSMQFSSAKSIRREHQEKYRA